MRAVFCFWYCRINIYVFNGEQATFVCEQCRASEGNEPVYHFWFRKAFLCHQETSSYAWQWHFKVQWPLLGPTEENCCSWILHGQSQGTIITIFFFCTLHLFFVNFYNAYNPNYPIKINRQGMLSLMLESTAPLMKKWEASIETQGGTMAEIRIEEDLRSVSADVISRTCFGSSYFKGKQIFSKLRTLQQTISCGSVLFGLPTFG